METAVIVVMIALYLGVYGDDIKRDLHLDKPTEQTQEQKK